VIATRNFAAQFMCTSLVDSCNKYTNKHFVEVSHSPDYLDLEVGDVLDLLGRDELHVENEEQVRHRRGVSFVLDRVSGHKEGLYLIHRLTWWVVSVSLHPAGRREDCLRG